ncbi:hypothetical protein [Tessaracoccus sp.]
MAPEPAEHAAHPVERSTGGRGRILDPLLHASIGAVIGASFGLVGIVLLGIMRSEGGGGAIDETGESGIVVALVVILGLCVTAAVLSGERVLRYARVVGEALWNDGRRATPVPPQQYRIAVGETKLGKAFIGSLWLGVLVVSCSAFLLLASIVFLFDDPDTEAVLTTVGSAGMLTFGIGIFCAVRRLRRWRGTLLGTQANTTREPPEDVPVMTVLRSRQYHWGTSLQRATGSGARLCLAVGLTAFGIWALTTGEVAFIGGSIKVLPESLQNQPPRPGAQVMLENSVMLIGVVLLLAALVMWIIHYGLSLAQRVSSGHLVRDLAGRDNAGVARPDPALLREILETPSPLRRVLWFAAAAAGMAAVLGPTLSSPRVSGASGVVLLVTCGVVVVAVALDALSAERVREFHNLLWRTWPHATSPGRPDPSRHPPARTKTPRKDPATP